ncbi:DNA-directed RNA polymerase I subunit RPA34 [Dromiciops gliroides]|uniref:DNA-directed RNA polymerase I subunit RPA34 n=1 Tax=Dromiciops gliroides TaxID=33562 RepID=UPI001CC8201A|nr:DNA-directed RNA polymerase I subunit RPA34 [Dromiciops gliroides]
MCLPGSHAPLAPGSNGLAQPGSHAPRPTWARRAFRDQCELSGVGGAAGTMPVEDVRSRLCPDDFCPATSPAERPSSLCLDALRKPGTELWLIRTPADFSPASLNGCKVSLVGLQTLKSHRNEAGVRQRYRVLSNTSTGLETLLAPSSSADGQLVPAPALRGTLSVTEVPRTKASSQALHAIPTSPPPQIPPGLRPRFQAFGGKQPVLGSPAQTAAGEGGEGRSSRKRKKAHLVSPNANPPEVLNGVGGLNSAPALEMPEPTTEQMPVKTEEEVAAPLPAKKKKKKKKRELEEEAPEPAGEAPGLELPQEAVLSPSKTKKSKKRRELEGRRPESEVQMDLQEEKAPASAKKKSQKKQKAGEMVAPARAVGMAGEEEKEMVGLPPAKRKKEEPGGEMPTEAEVTEPLGEAEPSYTKRKKKKRRKPEEEEGVAPEPPTEMESLAGVSESDTLSPRQGVEKKKKKKKKRLHQEEVGTVEA